MLLRPAGNGQTFLRQIGGLDAADFADGAWWGYRQRGNAHRLQLGLKFVLKRRVMIKASKGQRGRQQRACHCRQMVDQSGMKAGDIDEALLLTVRAKCFLPLLELALLFAA